MEADDRGTIPAGLDDRLEQLQKRPRTDSTPTIYPTPPEDTVLTQLMLNDIPFWPQEPASTPLDTDFTHFDFTPGVTPIETQAPQRNVTLLDLERVDLFVYYRYFLERRLTVSV